MNGSVAALARHPVKGFTAEPMASVALEAGRPFPFDRLYAVEDGDCGFDPAAPAHVRKTRLAVLATYPCLARVATRWDDASGLLRASAPGATAFAGNLEDAGARTSFARWLEAFIDTDANQPQRGRLTVLSAEGHVFFDDIEGAVSVLNLASVRDASARMGADLDPLRFRANILVEGWPAWREHDLATGARIRIGAAELEVVKPIPRCIAVHVDPARGVRDVEVCAGLHAAYGHVDCGAYLRVLGGGSVVVGDEVTTAT